MAAHYFQPQANQPLARLPGWRLSAPHRPPWPPPGRQAYTSRRRVCTGRLRPRPCTRSAWRTALSRTCSAATLQCLVGPRSALGFRLSALGSRLSALSSRLSALAPADMLTRPPTVVLRSVCVQTCGCSTSQACVRCAFKMRCWSCVSSAWLQVVAHKGCRGLGQTPPARSHLPVRP